MKKNRINLLMAIVDKLDERLKFYQEFLPITIKEIEDKETKRLKYLQELNNEKLKPYAIKAHIQTDYIESEKSEIIEKINKRYNLKLRALKQSKKRKLKKLKESEKQELIEKEFNTKEKQIKKTHESELARVNSYYQGDSNLVEAKTAYKQMKEKLDKEYDLKLQRITKKTNIKKHKISKKIERKIKSLNISIKRNSNIIQAEKKNIADDSYGVSKDSILKLENLTMRFGGLVAVNNLSFEVKQGEIFGLIGPNGAGKTTIFNCITRFYRPTAGDMYFRLNEFDVTKLNDYKVHNIVKLGIARTFQNVELIWELSILDNLLVAAHTKYQTGFFGHLIHSNKLAREETVYRKKAQDILALLDLLPYQNALPIGLPYGILKKIELARTLMINPKMIILDEPAAGLNDQETQVLAQTIRKINKEYNTTIFLVEHDMGLVMDICDTVCAISFGKKLAIGTPKEIQENKDVRVAYLGEEQ